MNEENIRKGLVIGALVAFSSLLGILSTNLGVTLHELFLHNGVAWILGCSATSDANVYTGITMFLCEPGNPIQMILIGLSAPLGAFIIGMLLWLWDKDSVLRFVGLIIMMYSSIPSLFPLIPGSDMAFAISYGFSPLFGWIIYFVVTGVFYLALLEEILDRNVLDAKKIPFLIPSGCKGKTGSRLKACMRRKR